MTDWNGDGKHDFHDDYVLNEIIKKPPDETHRSRKRSSSGPGRTVIIVMAVVVIWQLINLLAGLRP